MPSLTLAEQLLYSTVKLTAYKNDIAISTGTGFFMNFAEIGDSFVPTIVTNKHVIEGCDVIVAICQFDDNGMPSGRFVRCSIRVNIGSYINHPDPNVDLCALPISDIIQQSIDDETPILLRSLGLSLVPKADEWCNFDAIEDVTMVGCPNGISDTVNNLPIVRRGITASSLTKNYNGKNEFLIDMACFPGSSGSPVFIYDRNGYVDHRSNNYRLGSQRLILVGVLYAGPQITNNGHIILGNAPSVAVASMMHLGNVIKSSALEQIDIEVRRHLGLSIV